jgi:hypothetical protein
VGVTGSWFHTGMPHLTISCDDCRMQGTPACEDCIVSFMCERDAAAVVADIAELRALRLLGRTGLVPPLRHVRRADVPLECG